MTRIALGRHPSSGAQVRKPAKMFRRWRMKKLRHVLRMSRARVAQQPPLRTFFVPKYGCEYSL
jgi:hypothetical protein